MRMSVLIVLLLTLSSSFMFGDDCAQGSLASYIAAGSCTVGDKTFSGFSYSPTGTGTLVGASDVQVAPD